MQVEINIKNKNLIIPDEILAAAGGDELVAAIFINRGYNDPDTIKQMLNDSLYQPMTPWEFPEMETALDRVEKAIRNGESIAVYGDYDVDGVTSTGILVQCLRSFTSKVTYHVPDRFTEGYGMNEGVIRKLGENGVNLIITCDCGVSNHKEISLAKELGMDVLVTDHHNLPEKLPDADVILNPKLLPQGHRARNISGCGMAYFLCLGLLERNGRAKEAEKYLDLLALSLVADVVSLNGENRYLLKKGLPMLFKTERLGLRLLFSIIEKNYALQSEEDIAFQIAPRINAAGRMESAKLPVELLLTCDSTKAANLAQKIDFLNTERKRVQQQIIDEALEMVEHIKKNRTVLVLYGEHWHHGIIGIAAGKVCEKYGKPAILLSLKEDGETVVGSARSTEDINIYELIKGVEKHLVKFGGHSQAAGLSLKKADIENFTSDIEALAETKFFIREKIQKDVDMEMQLPEIDETFLSRLSLAGPYGEGFESPSFLTRNVNVISDRKTDKNHHIMVIGCGEHRIKAVKWQGENESYEGRIFDVTYTPGWNTFRGARDLQLTLDFLLKASGEKTTVFEGQIIDERRLNAVDLSDKYPGSLFFYEGLRQQCPLDRAVGRNGIKPANILVFLSTPSSTSLFREVVALANPKQIVLSFLVHQDYSPKGFMMNLMGIVKHFTIKTGGWAYVEELSSRLGIEIAVLKAGLRCLKAMGKLEYFTEEDKVFLGMCDNKPSERLPVIQKVLMDALAEKNAYQTFLMKLPVDKFRKYLT